MTEIAKEFWEISLSRLPAEEMNAFRAAMETGAHARGLRLRPGVTIENVRAALPDAYEPIPWARGAYYIASESRAGAHPLHAAGAYYLQEPSAMAAVAALDVRPGQRVLDLCAAPGGKSTQIAGLLEGCGALVCNEIVPSRAKILSQNIERMGVANAAVTNEAPPKLATRFARLFDRVLVDAPCSGEGMFRREEAARAEWRPDSPAGCAARQREVLQSAAETVAPGGLLVYSTCTFNEMENEQNVRAFLAAHDDFEAEDFSLPGVGASENGCLRLWPHRLRGEGHFVARMRRKGEPETETPEGDCVSVSELLPGFDARIPGRLVRAGNMLWARPECLPEMHGVRALREGLCLGEMRGKLFFPDHALALAMPGDIGSAAELDGEAAKAYLRGESLPAPDGTGKGWLRVRYLDMPLGWAKCADGQLKNHLPKGLRRNYEV